MGELLFKEKLHKEVSLVLQEIKLGARYKISKFHLISCCGNFGETQSFDKVSGELPRTLRKLCVFTKFLAQEISSNFGILRVRDSFLGLYGLL